MDFAPADGAPIRRRFSLTDQEAFAVLSGDRNPIHLDEVAARRTQAGAAVVHGVHGLLWALEQVAQSRPLGGLRTIAARFNRFVYVGAQAELRLGEKGEALIAELFADGQAATTIKLEWGAPGVAGLSAALPGDAPIQFGASPDAPPFEAMHSLAGRCALPVDDAMARALFPTLSTVWGPDAVAAIATASGVVGMRCPGLHSLFSQLTLRRVDDAGQAPGLGWRTVRADARARWVGLELAGGGWEGEIVCLARAEPVQVRSMADLAQRVRPDEFAGRTALVVGGSRGLGAVTGKLLAAGGAQVVLTYARGAQEAEAIAAEIRSARGDPKACDIRLCDVTGDVAAQLAGLPAGLTHLYYFATPRITRQSARVYDRQTMDDFLAVYVDGFSSVWDALAGAGPLAVLYPSTVFLDERPKGMTEYAMAKAAAEVLCADLGRRRPDIALATPRIPRVLTDQTATVPPTPTADPVDIMLPLLRAQA